MTITFSAICWVGLGGALGSVARYALGTHIMQAGVLLHGHRFPLGTLVVNLLGCLFIGMLAALAQRCEWFTPTVRLFLMTGILGGFTTFSSFGLESVELLQRQQWLLAGLYVGSSTLFGLLAVWLGMQSIAAA